ncbi:hypothetical protein BJ138DRAFT_1086124 [Hygrophoropsis aurantiaca]|uniref:Uncharacterized protein n=1 Tax=Hygrophoropsis aurantiaca TaxID=72124 RepID=A0ACB8ADH7_9AGAM|nr:hypothetical protein BJ138DRAFT_1086124 [Hygrophoropsis aurantiaca]
MFSDRKSSYKAPPTIVTDKLVSQETRRKKALEEQKQRRAKKFDSTRQLDSFADLNLGPSDDEGDDVEETPEIIREGVSGFVSLITKSKATPNSTLADSIEETEQQTKKRGKNRRKRNKPKPNKWADKCMYAELLEMNGDNAWNDGLPADLEGGWVAVAPVPVGKRCLAVTHQSAGVVGIPPNTTLRSRVLGKLLLPRFPSALPPLTILDCILDVNWRDNGILHVLDVLKWKGQDVGECETPFRFWWRDTRLAELPKYPPPSIPFQFASPHEHQVSLSSTGTQHSATNTYHFPYPTSFIPIPYNTDTSLPCLSSSIIPGARTSRHILVDVPVNTQKPFTSVDMPIDRPHAVPSQLTTPVNVGIEPDGLLLYVSQASFEPGTSPLSCWIPIRGYSEGGQNQGLVTEESPLDLFQRLVQRRMSKQRIGNNENMQDESMDI